MRKEYLSEREVKIIGEGQFNKYAILVPLISRPEGKFLLFEKRSTQLNRQPGEICFPGGRIEVGESPRDCAIRETMEELCITADKIEVLGPGDLFVSPFNLLIYPFIGEIHDYQYTYSADEVEETIMVPLNFFFTHEPELFQNKLINQPSEDFPYEKVPGGQQYPWASGIYDVLFYHYEEYIIWGLTARIVQSAASIMKEYGVDESLH